MSRYIEYHDICSAICNQQDGTGMTYEALAHAMVEIQLAPSIDIVRCGECKWGKPYSDKQLKCDALGLGGLKFPDDFCSYGSRSEKPNNCEHITEDGVTCAKYPACDDCIDNPLNKVKGSERLVKGSERSSE